MTTHPGPVTSVLVDKWKDEALAIWKAEALAYMEEVKALRARIRELEAALDNA